MRYSCAHSVSSLVLTLLIAASASAVTMDWTFVGNRGNACDPQPQVSPPQGCFGAVGYSYNIGTYEVTNAQYAEFLNAKAASDPLGLYNTSTEFFGGGITRSGSSGSYAYTALAGRENMPVHHVSWFDALRFANWMHNGQGSGDTERGAYTLLGGTPRPSYSYVTREAAATVFLPSRDEWYKAAYYDAISTSFFDFPAGTDAPMVCSEPTAVPNRANCRSRDGVTSVGSYSGSRSPYGTFDQGGNVEEWNEEFFYLGSGIREVRGGAYHHTAAETGAARRLSPSPTQETNYRGFRLAMIPEPSTGLLMAAGLLGLAGWRRVRA